MATWMLSTDEILAILDKEEMSKELQEPQRCKRCEQLLAPVLEEGRVRFECPLCDEPSRTQ